MSVNRSGERNGEVSACIRPLQRLDPRRVRARVALRAIPTAKERRAIFWGWCRARRDDSDAAGKGGTWTEPSCVSEAKK